MLDCESIPQAATIQSKELVRGTQTDGVGTQNGCESTVEAVAMVVPERAS